MPEPLVVTRLDEPTLRFDYENRLAAGADPYEGLRTYGPYDASERRRDGIAPVRVVLVGRADRPDTMKSVREALGARRLAKLNDVFQLHFVDEIRVPATKTSDEAVAYREAIAAWFGRSPYKTDVDLAVVLHENALRYRGASPYYASKAGFMRQGVPTQSICYDNVAPRNLENFGRYYVANILTACYAKTGGTPWVVQAGASNRPQVTLGVATTAVMTDGGDVERYVGISTIFRENGAFVLWDITNPERDLERYEAQLEETVVRAITTFETRENKDVTRIACHVSGKRAGYRELESIQRALDRFPNHQIVADVVHVAEDASLWLMDGADASLLPKPGLLTHLTLDGTSALMHTEGRGGRRGFLTRPLRLGLHSELPDDGCRDVYQHLYDLRWMSWRSVRPSGGPVSVSYPQKMARLLAYLHEQEEVEALDILPALTTKAWFL